MQLLWRCFIPNCNFRLLVVINTTFFHINLRSFLYAKNGIFITICKFIVSDFLLLYKIFLRLAKCLTLRQYYALKYEFRLFAARCISEFTTHCSTLAYVCVVLIFVCPNILLTISIGTPSDNVIVVANVCRAE